MQYLEEFGNYTFDEQVFNEIDNVIFSALSYVEFEEIMENDECITIKEASDRYFQKYEEQEISSRLSFVKDCPFLLQKMATCRRYASLFLLRPINIVDVQTVQQFAAITIALKNHYYYISFRGTDDSMIGWKEDFRMSYLEVIPSQKEAVTYLENVYASLPHRPLYKAGFHSFLETIKGYFKKPKLLLGGHSKGGNLAIYAGCKSSKRIKKQIATIFNNDGPGFHQSFVETPEYKEMVAKIHMFLPVSSFFGRLLEHQEECHIVLSDGRGFFQHNVFTWQIEGAHFMYEENTSLASKRYNTTIRKWLASLDEEKRAAFIEVMFALLARVGITCVGDILKNPRKCLMMIVKVLPSLPEEERKMLSLGIKTLLQSLDFSKK